MNSFDSLPAIISLRSHIRYLNGMILALEREESRLDSQVGRKNEINDIIAKQIEFTGELQSARNKINNWRQLHYAYRANESGYYPQSDTQSV